MRRVVWADFALLLCTLLGWPLLARTDDDYFEKMDATTWKELLENSRQPKSAEDVAGTNFSDVIRFVDGKLAVTGSLNETMIYLKSDRRDHFEKFRFSVCQDASAVSSECANSCGTMCKQRSKTGGFHNEKILVDAHFANRLSGYVWFQQKADQTLTVRPYCAYGDRNGSARLEADGCAHFVISEDVIQKHEDNPVYNVLGAGANVSMENKIYMASYGTHKFVYAQVRFSTPNCYYMHFPDLDFLVPGLVDPEKETAEASSLITRLWSTRIYNVPIGLLLLLLFIILVLLICLLFCLRRRRKAKRLEKQRQEAAAAAAALASAENGTTPRGSAQPLPQQQQQLSAAVSGREQQSVSAQPQPVSSMPVTQNDTTTNTQMVADVEQSTQSVDQGPPPDLVLTTPEQPMVLRTPKVKPKSKETTSEMREDPLVFQTAQEVRTEDEEHAAKHRKNNKSMEAAAAAAQRTEEEEARTKKVNAAASSIPKIKVHVDADGRVIDRGDAPPKSSTTMDLPTAPADKAEEKQKQRKKKLWQRTQTTEAQPSADTSD